MNRLHVQVSALTVSLVSALLWVQPSAAQVVPDGTLPVGERSQVSGDPNAQIDGGARRGGNLFHSFSQFSIPTGGAAYFNNATDVQNIFSRVTGRSVSSIDGVIRANGTANLFLLNPNGILFGSNARLNIGGSFVATTANSINFADQFQYSATNPQTTPLLTVSIPVGLQMGTNPAPIRVQGTGYNLSQGSIFVPITVGKAATGLEVSTGQTLALIGGNLDIQGGVLTAEQGRIELGSVRDGQVDVGDRFALGYSGIQSFGEIHLSQRALVNASNSGVIQVQGGQVSLTDGSLLLIQNQAGQSGGSIAVTASKLVDLRGTSLDGSVFGGLESQALGAGSGADLTVKTQRFIVREGAIASAFSYGSGPTGQINVNATDSMQVIGIASSSTLGSLVAAIAVDSSDTGNITLSTSQLRVVDGGSIGTTTVGTGRSGDVTINTSEAIEVTGTNFLRQSNIAAGTVSGEAGRLTIHTERLRVQAGGTINTVTIGDGSAGSLIINARESIELDGNGTQFSAPSSVGAFGFRFTTEQPQDPALLAPEAPTGVSGNATITTGTLTMTNGARVDVSNAGTGPAGLLGIRANSITLNNQAGITASTASGQGGNIQLQVRDTLLLRQISGVSAIAGGTGNGGNIQIDAGAIVAVPTENSDISANSVNARGGNVTINTSGIFGIQFRPQDTPLSDITATGATSTQQGTVQVNIDRFDPTSGLVQLPSGVVDSSRLIAQGCPADRGDSFVITGRGGLPPRPEQQLDDDAEWDDRELLTVAQQRGRGETDLGRSAQSNETRRPGESYHSTFKTQNSKLPYLPVTEATRWQTTSTGEIILVANTENSTMQNSFNAAHNWLNHSTSCQGKQ
ncbi:filamentous hemagglutinin N-terminal domain-containing protein [Phormidium sp. FACHB-592]|uniref:S-layer family protein n=1 Tax=Stenomitos frigidus AS-A4 TaxID=2933935 RepID=A0ABV0KSB6_9CYAN|nr:filamentous hemagglutinin N-terminal domain-containing protein [Phormidium sp. FACHB-592]MBD2074256.1 filamentous hemagglutinin N-terminal domain-containing protein [Phormidium sp. FACHB-592]